MTTPFLEALNLPVSGSAFRAAFIQLEIRTTRRQEPWVRSFMGIDFLSVGVRGLGEKMVS